MRIRALLFIPALVAATLAIGVSSASAATLFLNTAHAIRVSVGGTTTATSEGPVTFTAPTGAFFNTCNHMTLNLRVLENADARSTLTVYDGSVGTCHPRSVKLTFLPPWRLTILGNGFMVGGSQAYPATLHNPQFDFSPSFLGPFTETLDAGVTVTQPTVATSPICVDFNDAGTLVNHETGILAYIDAKFCLTSPVGTGSSWSLT